MSRIRSKRKKHFQRVKCPKCDNKYVVHGSSVQVVPGLFIFEPKRKDEQGKPVDQACPVCGLKRYSNEFYSEVKKKNDVRGLDFKQQDK